MSIDETVSPVRPGDVVAEKYRVERVLGVGGMGVVVAAMHMDLDERVALKFLLPEGASTPGVAARFAQEARAAAKVKSEHVARVIDVGRMPSGEPFMVMEYLDGEDLAQTLARLGPLPVDVAVGYVVEAAHAIAEAHSLGIVHRDLKPGNLFLARRPSGPPIVKVLDFGISKVSSPLTAAAMTKTSAMLGSPFYMSPEQLSSSKSVDPRSDVWALGVVLFELLAGQPPFTAEFMPELIAAILQRPAPSLSAFRSDVPPQLEAVILRCLAKSPDDRFTDVRGLVEGLVPFLADGGASAGMRISRVDFREAMRASNATPFDGPRSPSNTVGPVSSDPRGSGGAGGRRKVAAWAGLGALALLAAGVGTAAFRQVTQQRTPAAGLVGDDFAPRDGGASLATVVTAPAIAPAPPSTGSESQASVPAASASTASSRSPHSPRPAASASKPAESASAAPVAPRAPGPDCNPPFVINPVTGHRDYKPECLQ